MVFEWQFPKHFKLRSSPRLKLITYLHNDMGIAKRLDVMNAHVYATRNYFYSRKKSKYQTYHRSFSFRILKLDFSAV